MLFYSTENKNLRIGLREAILKGLADDNGLFMPETMPALSSDTLRKLPDLSFHELAWQLSAPYVVNELGEKALKDMIEEAFNFEVPLIPVQKDLFSLELFHGPTLAFKDFGARFLARLLGHFTQDLGQEVTILVATSGDTGSAVANGFLGVPGVRVFVLYPSGLVSPSQEKQFTTLGKNITALEVKGTFDDCQRLVKQAFMDADLRQAMKLTSANSISLGRLIPQMFYYGWGAARLISSGKKIIASVPSGNFGNLTAGLMAKRMGIPIEYFIAATNVNDIVPVWLETGSYKPRASVATIANAMDVGNPSNFARILDLYNNDHEAVCRDINGFRYTNEQIRNIMRACYGETGYILDPHGATGYESLRIMLKNHPGFQGFFAETAHPAKFADTVEETLNIKLPIPEKLQEFIRREKKSLPMSNLFNDFKEFLLKI